jgi:hypothetical protein
MPITPGYAYLTLGNARAAVAARLEDPANTYWTAFELNDLIVEAVHTWQAFTATYKQRATFSISPGGGIGGSAFYDLGSLSGGILGHVVTDQQLLNIVFPALLEPSLTSTWTGTGQFTFGQISTALQNRINRWLTDTGAGVTRTVVAVGSGAANARVFLPEHTLDVRRAAWIGATSTTTLWRDDEFAMQAFLNPGYANPTDPPKVWGKFVMPPYGIDLYPPPLSAGNLETLIVDSGPLISTTPAAVIATPIVLQIPEDYFWGVKFGVLSDLLSADGPARDPARAVYAEQRYQESVQLYRLNATLVATQIAGVPVWSGSVFEMDAFLASWQNQPGAPQFAGMCDRNLVAFGPIPNQTYTITMDVVANIPVPAVDGDFIQVDRGAIDPLLDYVEHLAAFKMAGQEFQMTDKLRQNFIAAAALENARITKTSFYRSAMQLPAQRQQAEVPRI